MKLIVIVFMIMYLYALSFGIFMTEIFRIPAPFIFCFPLVFLFYDQSKAPFLYIKEIILLSIAVFLYYVVGLSDFIAFTKNILIIMICSVYFNYFVGKNSTRLKTSILIFYGLLTFSAIIMICNHFYDLTYLRSQLMNEKIIQSPAGIAIYQFNFGYQLAALTPFLFIYTCTFNKSFIFKIIVLMICLIFLLLGMQRSAFIAFILSTSLFLVMYYRFRAVILISISVLFCGLIYYFFINDSFDGISNIITKTETDNPSYNRASLTAENLRIYFDYPFGLIFYGKTWGDVIYRDYTFAAGITSHNAYLMFVTYLGPFLGLGLLISIYHRVGSIFLNIIQVIRDEDNRLLVCLCFSFLSVSINALSHNSWLIDANGPTVFLFFGILHMYKIKMVDSVIENKPLKTYSYA